MTEAVAFGIPDELYGEVVAVAVVGAVSQDEVVSFLAKKLTKYQQECLLCRKSQKLPREKFREVPWRNFFL